MPKYSSFLILHSSFSCVLSNCLFQLERCRIVRLEYQDAIDGFFRQLHLPSFEVQSRDHEQRLGRNGLKAQSRLCLGARGGVIYILEAVRQPEVSFHIHRVEWDGFAELALGLGTEAL